MAEIFLGLGSNLPERLENLKKALKCLQKKEIDLISISRVYETEPFGYTEQPKFYNMAIRALTKLEPEDLLLELKQIERDMGREAAVRWGPRIIDIDILLYNDIILKTDELNIPHSGILERYFVLMPLSELCPDMKIPGTDLTVNEALKNIEGSLQAEPVAELELT